MFFRLGSDFRAGPSFAVRPLAGRFLTLPGFALLIVPAELVPLVFINIFKRLPSIKTNRPNGNFP
jgi:hypothetical protein